VTADSDLVDSLLSDTGTEPGNLALLEHALQQLWERRNGSNSLTSGAYSAIGRLKGAIGKHADHVYTKITDTSHRQIVERIFLELVQFGTNAPDTRRRVPKDTLLQLGHAETVEQLLTALASARLITVEATPGHSDQAAFVEVSHEALIRDWPRLREWITKNRLDLVLERRLFDLATAWSRVRESALLLAERHSRLPRSGSQGTPAPHHCWWTSLKRVSAVLVRAKKPSDSGNCSLSRHRRPGLTRRRSPRKRRSS
jgi:hypothetical protein